MDLSRLTVVIPTYKRPAFVDRQIRFWRDFDAQVLILDGTSESGVPEGLPPNVRYLASGKSFVERMYSAGDHISTEFVALLADDEFFMPSGLDDAIRHLDQNQSTVGCVGRSLYFFIDQGRFLVSHAYRDWKPFPDQFEELTIRLDADLPPNKTHMAMYGVFRRHHWDTMRRSAYGRQFSCGYVYERLLNLQRTLLGPTMILDTLLWLRSKENPPVVSADIPRLGGHDFVSWATSTAYQDEVHVFKEIAKQMLQESGLPTEDVALYVHRFFEGGVLRQSTKEIAMRRSLLRKFGALAMTRTPKSVRRLSKRLIPSDILRFIGWEGKKPETIYAELKNLGTAFNASEVERVRELCLHLHFGKTHTM